MFKKCKILSVFLAFCMIITSIAGCGSAKKTKDGLTKVRLNEVARSVFYAPMYIAINQGFFKEHNIDIDLQTGQGADKVMQAVASNSADIGFCGPEQTLYINNQGRQDPPVVFAQLTQKDGSFLVGRKENKDFKWSDIKGSEVIGGRPGGVPAMALQTAMKKNGIDPDKDVTMLNNIDFSATAGAFKGGSGDYVALFEPTATSLQQDGSGYILASVGEEAGPIPYTCFFALKSYIKDNPELIQDFTDAIYEGQQWFFSHSDAETADVIAEFFPGTEKSTIETVVKNYRNIDALAHDPQIKEEDLNRLIDIIQGYDSTLLPDKPAFEDIVDNSFAEKAVQK